ncbi:MAG: hypothetical protein FE835_18625, partial [Gammaproteobacteria bacterium]|nr:hypothetical protein [Gammaproteobacteria bacterium]
MADHNENDTPQQNQPGGEKGEAGIRGVFNSRDFFNARYTRPNYLSDVKSGKPQTVIKLISSVEGYEVRRLMLYIARERKRDKENGIGAVNLTDQHGNNISGREDVIAQYDEWKGGFVSRDLKPGISSRVRRHRLIPLTEPYVRTTYTAP